jgi:Trp operon repressor
LIAAELETLLAALDASLLAAGISQEESGQSLEASIVSATSGINSLSASKEALRQAMSARDAELWIWRGATAAGALLALLVAIWR